jgi:hypothetical protein
MAVRAKDRFFRFMDAPMTWTRALIYGTLIWVVVILLLGQVPSWIIYKADTDVTALINFTKHFPGFGRTCAALGSGQAASLGCNPRQIDILRDIVANTVQMGSLVIMLVIAYKWQESKRKRTGTKGVQDVVKGYMPGK